MIITVTVEEEVVKPEEPSEPNNPGDSDDDDDDDYVPPTSEEQSGNESVVTPIVPSVGETIEAALKEGKNPVVMVDEKGQLNIESDMVKQIVENNKVLEIKISDSISMSVNTQILTEQGSEDMNLKVSQPDTKEIAKANAGIQAIGGEKFMVTVDLGTNTVSFTEPVQITFDLSKEK